MAKLKRKDMLYYARIMPSVGIYEVCELAVRTVEDTWFVGIDKRDKHAYIFSYNDIDKILFFEREAALKKVIEAEKNSVNIKSEECFEEY